MSMRPFLVAHSPLVTRRDKAGPVLVVGWEGGLA
jgi:hypothetical protein